MKRIEHDSLGKVSVPLKAYYGAQTQRAVDNFPISHVQSLSLIRAYAIVKKAAALSNKRLGVLEARKAKAIMQAADEVVRGKWDDHFVVDMYQAGAGTSTNMNLNEVIANRAEEILGGKRGSYKLIHPNDDVNRSQSTNDTFHAASRMAVSLDARAGLIPELTALHDVLLKKSKQFHTVVKTGRTHLQDAMPITLGQEFIGWAASLKHALDSLKRAEEHMRVLPIGGTAVGTGVNSPLRYAELMVKEINAFTRGKFEGVGNFFETHSNQDAEVQMSAALKGIAVSLSKCANDLILLSSGPYAGFGDIVLPSVQPGSSIMPGKINPSIPEMMNMVCFRLIGNDLVVTEASRSGQLELNVYQPLIVNTLLESVHLLTNAARVFSRKCVNGVKAHHERIATLLEKNPIIATVLTPVIGYEKTAEVITMAYQRGVPVRQIVLEKKLLPQKDVDKILDPRRLLRPG